MPKKINPRRRPATLADVKRAKDKATDDAIKLVVYMVMYVLIDKHGAPKEDIQQLGEEINYVADSIARGYVKCEDIRRTLEEEYGFVWECGNG